MIGFLVGAFLTATERVNMTVNVCPQILEGTLERDVSVFATTMDMSARGPYFCMYRLEIANIFIIIQVYFPNVFSILYPHIKATANWRGSLHNM